MCSVPGGRKARKQQHRRPMLVAAQGDQLQTGTAKGANRARRVQPMTGRHACAVMPCIGAEQEQPAAAQQPVQSLAERYAGMKRTVTERLTCGAAYVSLR